MPEGPSLVILKEALKEFKGKKIIDANGNAKTFDLTKLKGKSITAIKSWGKHLLICFPDFFLRVHLLMFGTYRINERKETQPRLRLEFKNAEFSLYACSIRLIEEKVNEVYDWSADVLNSKWNASKAIKKIKSDPSLLACDVLLDQNTFAGVGNIIKCEVLFRTRIHPLSVVGKIPHKKLKTMVDEASNYSYDFLKWKRKYVLKKNLLIYGKKTCPRCKIPRKLEVTGLTRRRSFFCDNCQILYK